MRRLVPALAIPAFLILLVASSGLALASESVTGELREGETLMENFTNPNLENQMILTATSITWPLEDPPIFISPTTIPPGENRLVSIHFIELGEERNQVPDRRYAVKISGGGNDLFLLYLVVENSPYIPPDQLAELKNEVRELAQRIEALNGSFEEWVDTFSAKLQALEDTLTGNWADNIESIRLWVLTELENIRNTPHENSPAENSDNLKGAIAEIVNEIIINEVAPQLKRDSQDDLAKIRSERETDIIYSAVVAAIVAIVVVAVASKFGMIKRTFGIPTGSKTGPADEVTDDQIAMLENTIGAMRGRSESTEAKEIELDILKKRKKLAGLGGE